MLGWQSAAVRLGERVLPEGWLGYVASSSHIGPNGTTPIRAARSVIVPSLAPDIASPAGAEVIAAVTNETNFALNRASFYRYMATGIEV